MHGAFEEGERPDDDGHDEDEYTVIDAEGEEVLEEDGDVGGGEEEEDGDDPVEGEGQADIHRVPEDSFGPEDGGGRTWPWIPVPGRPSRGMAGGSVPGTLPISSA